MDDLRLDKILLELNEEVKDIVYKIDALDSNSETYEEDREKLIGELAKKKIDYIKNVSYEDSLILLNCFYNECIFRLTPLIKTNDSVILSRILDVLNLNNVSIENIVNLNEDTMRLRFILSNPKDMIDHISFWNSLKSSINYNKVNILESKDDFVERFAPLFVNVEKSIFLSSNWECDAYETLNDIFFNENISDSVLQDIFDNIVMNNKKYLSYDFENVIKENPDLLCQISGCIGKMTDELFEELFCYDEDNLNFELYDELFQAIIDANSSKDISLYWFFSKASDFENEENKELFDFLRTKDYYNEYISKDLAKEVIDAYSNGKKPDLPDYVVQDSILSKVSYKNSEDLLDIFMNSDDIEFQSSLIIPLSIMEAKKLRDEKSLDFSIKLSSEFQENNTCGSYNKSTNILYLNPYFAVNSNNPKIDLVNSLNTVFHEVRHIDQSIEVKEAKFNMDNLLHSMDFLLAEQNSGYKNYYSNNYETVSYEQDARCVAFADVMEYFNKYPTMQNECVSQFKENISAVSDYKRLNETVPNYFEPTILVSNFEKVMNHILFLNFEASKGFSSVEKAKRIIKEDMQAIIDDYPTLALFFDFDFENAKIKLKPLEYFTDLENKYSLMEDSLEREEGLQVIRYIKNSIKINDKLKKNFVSDNEELTFEEEQQEKEKMINDMLDELEEKGDIRKEDSRWMK